MRARRWLTGLVVVVGGLAAGARETAVVAAVERGTQGPAAQRGRWTADVKDGWRDDRGERRVQLSLSSRDGDERWGFGVPFAELEGLPAAARDGAASDVTFRLVREAGTVSFRGSFSGGRGSGDYGFAPSGSYASAMASLGYRDLDATRQMRLAVLDVNTGFAREIRDSGQGGVGLDDLIRFRIHGVSGGVIRELASLGYRELGADDLVRLRIHGATPERIRGFQQAGLTGVSADDLVRLRIHGVTPGFIEGLRTRGYSGLSADDLTRLRIHGVSLDGIDALRAAGVDGASAGDLVKFRIHGVSAGFVRDMRAVGITSTDADDLVRMRIHRVSAEMVREARRDGYEIRDAGDAVDLAIHGRRLRRRR